MLVAGLDSSTQSVKLVVRDAESGALVRERRVAHPDGTEVHPQAWLDALADVTHDMLDGVEAMAVAGQQHGMVALDDRGDVVRAALLWNDTRSAPDADSLVAELGGPQVWADSVGSVPVASFTVTKARWMARVEPENARRTARMMLPHDYLTWHLAGRPDEAVTDRGEASGTGYWSPLTDQYREDLLAMALGHVPLLPRVCGPAEVAGHTPSGIVLVSLGTSGTAFAVSNVPARDASGTVAGFADATGHFLPLVCTLNAARIMTSTAAMLGVDLDAFAALALSAQPGSDGLVLLPYLDGERTPNLPDARGSLHGITRANFTPSNIARAAIEGLLGGLADAVAALEAVGVQTGRVLLVGGAAANPAVGPIASTMFAAPVVVPPAGEYVADGAARQAAWVVTQELPSWSFDADTSTYEPAPVFGIRDQYSAAFASLYG